MTKQLDILLHNVGPHSDLRLTFAPGVNILRGRNGAGKTVALEACATAFGANGDVSVKDGHISGTVAVDGTVVLQIGKRTNKAGQPSVEIGAYGPIHDIIDPGIKDPVRRDAATIKAILAMAPVAVDESVIKELTGGDAELAAVPLPADAPGNVLAVAEHFRVAANAKALEKEKEAERAKGAADVASMRLASLPPRTTDQPLGIAEALARATADRVAQVTLLAEQRKAQEERHQRIAATLGECPNFSNTDVAVLAAQSRVKNAQKELQDALDAVGLAEKELALAQAEETTAKRDHAVASEANRKWHQQNEALEEPITGPGPEEVAMAKIEALKAAAVFEEARSAAERSKVEDELAKALVGMEVSLKRSKELRSLAHGVSEALGVVLGKHGLGGFSVEERRLMYELDGKRLLFAERMSFGQRCRVALSIALKSYVGRFVPLDPAFWGSLQPKFQREMAELAKEMGVVLVSELPNDEDVITVERM